MSNAQKDLGYYTQMAQGFDAAQRIADAVYGTYAGAVEQGGVQRLVPELVALLEQAGGGGKSGG